MNIPIYVTRKTGDEVTGQFFVNAWLGLLLLYIFLFNVLGWGIFGLIELFSKVV